MFGGLVQHWERRLGFDLTALFDVNVDGVSPQWLIDSLSSGPAVSEVVEKYRDHWMEKEWRIDTSEASFVGGSVWGPGGFHFGLRSGRMDMYHMTSFMRFRSHPTHRQQLRRVCGFIASRLGSPRAILTHELMPYGDGRLEEVDATLRKLIGPPATNFEQLRLAADYFKPYAWFVDTFKDLESEGGADG